MRTLEYIKKKNLRLASLNPSTRNAQKACTYNNNHYFSQKIENNRFSEPEKT